MLSLSKARRLEAREYFQRVVEGMLDRKESLKGSLVARLSRGTGLIAWLEAILLESSNSFGLSISLWAFLTHRNSPGICRVELLCYRRREGGREHSCFHGLLAYCYT